MARRLPIRDAVSAGGVVWRQGAHGPEIVVGRTREDIWALPKGTPEPGEALEDAAVREVAEETGLLVSRGEKVGVIEYWFTQDGYRWHKYVHHWLMEPLGGGFADRDHEFEDVEWVPASDALDCLAYDDERRIVREALRRLEAPA